MAEVNASAVVRWMIHIACILIISSQSSISSGVEDETIYVQDEDTCGAPGFGNLRYPKEIELFADNKVSIISHTSRSQYYFADRTCVLSLIGQPNFQFEVTVIYLELDKKARFASGSTFPERCYDYLKIYDGPRVDNARLITNQTGLCGGYGTLQTQWKFTTCQSYITFEFNTDPEQDDMRGFELELIQFPKINHGNVYEGIGVLPDLAWSCYLKEFQDTWDKHDRVSASEGKVIDPTGLPNYNYDYNGISCHTCLKCSSDQFTESHTQSGCYMCGKQVEEGRADSDRICHSEISYMMLLRTFKEPIWEAGGYIGCDYATNEDGVTTKYCFCRKELCNTGLNIRLSLSFIVFSVTASFIFLLV